MRRNYKNRSFANCCVRATLKSRRRKLSNMGISYTPTRKDVIEILERNRQYNKKIA